VTGISAHEATASRVCEHASCARDANPRSRFCGEHSGHPSERRRALADNVRQLRDAGHTHRAIAELLGISRSYAADLDLDPEGSAARARKDGYRRPCPDCGRPMSGCNGLGPDAPEQCAECANLERHEERHWTAATIAASFQRFHDVTGRPPSTVDRMIHIPSVRAKLSPERITDGEAAFAAVDGDLPLPSIVNRECGSWDNALRLAGLPTNPTGGAAHRAPRLSQRRHVKDYIIFASSDGDTWQEVGQATARTPAAAIAQVAGSTDLEYVAIPTAAWVPVRVQPVTRFEVIAAA
jgi:hypothetical protein